MYKKLFSHPSMGFILFILMILILLATKNAESKPTKTNPGAESTPILIISDLTDSPDPFSPNGDGIDDTTEFSGKISVSGFEKYLKKKKYLSLVWRLTIRNSDGKKVKSFRNSQKVENNTEIAISQIWDGLRGRKIVKDGEYSYELEARIRNIHTEPKYGTIALATETIDLTPPEIVNLQPSDSIIIPNARPSISADFIDDNSGIDVSTVDVTLDEININSGSQINSTGFTYIPDVDLSEGAHTVTVDVKDNAGNSASQTQWSFIIDTISPQINITGVVDGSFSKEDIIPLVSVIDENIDTQSIALNGVDFVSGTTISEENEYILEVHALDKAGNSSTATVSFSIDKTLPQIAIAPVTSPTNVGTQTIIGSYIEDHIDIIEVDGVPAIIDELAKTYSLEIALREGENIIIVTATDLAGNISTETAIIVLDTTLPFAPVGLIATPGDTVIDLSWNSNSETDLAGYNLYRSETQGGVYTKINSILITQNSYQDTGLINGIVYYYVITAEDNAGNESDYSIEISVTPTTSFIVQISSPAQDNMLRGADIVSIIGTATCPDFKSYQLDFGEGIAPGYWYPIATGDTPVEDGPLGSWDTKGLHEPVYTIRLTVTDTNENQISDQINIDMFSIYNLSAVPNPFSPDGDGTLDITTITADISHTSVWTITLQNKNGNIVNTFADTGDSISQIWNGIDNSNNVVSDGEYTYQIGATEINSGVTASPATGLIRVKTGYNINIVATIPASQPVDLAMDGNKNLYILESGTNKVLIYDKDGYYQSYVSLATNGPKGMALDKNGNIYIADTGNHRVLKYKPDGTLDAAFGNAGIVGAQGQGDGQFNQPWGIGVDDEGNVYVTDSLNHRVQKFDSTGAFITEWGSQGTEPEQFNQPKGIFMDSDNNIHIADSLNNRIEEFSSSGSLWNYWGEAGSGEGQFSQPTDSCRDNYYLYVADTANNRIVKFNSYQQFLLNIEGIGLNSPSSVMIDPDPNKEYIWIADTGSSRVIKVELPMLDPKDVWNAMKQELRQKNIESTLAYFSEGAKEKYSQIFNRLTDELPRIVDEMQEIYPISVQGNVAEYIMVREESGEQMGYFVYFIKDESGNWMIDEW